LNQKGVLKMKLTPSYEIQVGANEGEHTYECKCLFTKYFDNKSYK